MGLTSTGLEISPAVRYTCMLQVLCFNKNIGLNLDGIVNAERFIDTHKHDPCIFLTVKFEFIRMNSWLIWSGFFEALFFRQSFLTLELGMGHFFRHQTLVISELEKHFKCNRKWNHFKFYHKLPSFGIKKWFITYYWLPVNMFIGWKFNPAFWWNIKTGGFLYLITLCVAQISWVIW